MPTRAMIALACITLGALAPTPTQATEPFEQVASYVQSALLNSTGIRSIGMGSTGTAAGRSTPVEGDRDAETFGLAAGVRF